MVETGQHGRHTHEYTHEHGALPLRANSWWMTCNRSLSYFNMYIPVHIIHWCPLGRASSCGATSWGNITWSLHLYSLQHFGTIFYFWLFCSSLCCCPPKHAVLILWDLGPGTIMASMRREMCQCDGRCKTSLWYWYLLQPILGRHILVLLLWSMQNKQATHLGYTQERKDLALPSQWMDWLHHWIRVQLLLLFWRWILHTRGIGRGILNRGDSPNRSPQE